MSFKKEFDKWKKKHDQHGSRAYGKFLMMRFAEEVCSKYPHYILKGGHLLWHYTKTPRSTVDVDFGYRAGLNEGTVRNELESVEMAEFSFVIREIKMINRDGGTGAAVRIAYTSTHGSNGVIDIDVVMDSNMDFKNDLFISKKINMATSENIIADKLSATFEFGAGNTRMKDFDDLICKFRQYSNTMDYEKLFKILEMRQIEYPIPKRYATEEMERRWINYLKAEYSRGHDLPDSFSEAIEIINKYLV